MLVKGETEQTTTHSRSGYWLLFKNQLIISHACTVPSAQSSLGLVFPLQSGDPSWLGKVRLQVRLAPALQLPAVVSLQSSQPRFLGIP